MTLATRKNSREDFELSSAVSQRLELLLLSDFGRALVPSSVRRVRDSIERDVSPAYAQDAAPFAYLYWGANYAKTYLALQSILPNLPNRALRILDLGCGSGASSAAVLQACADYGLKVEAVTGVDTSPTQLEWYREVLRPWMASRGDSSVINVRIEDALTCLSRATEFDLVVMSYLVAELKEPQKAELFRILEKRTPQYAEYLIIDSDRQGKPITTSRNGITKNLDIGALSIRLPFLKRLCFSIPPRYASLPYPSTDSAQLMTMCQQYFDAWKGHDGSLIRKIFAKASSYEILDNKRLSGVAAIQAYWAKNAREQRDVVTNIVSTDIGTYSLTAHWQAEFTRIDQRSKYHLDGWLTFIVLNHQIQYFIERYQRD